MSKEITKEMLFSYFANKATAIQKKGIDEWAKLPGNKELFYECLAQWESENLQYSSDVDAALRRHRRRLQLNTLPADADNTGGKSVPGRPFLKMSIAASLLLAALIGGYLSREKILLKTFVTAYGETRSVLLSDGTKVILNSNSTLTIPRFGFGEYTREVSLVGEGNFSVAHLPGNQLFVVRTVDGHDIVVLGTEFTVYTRLHRFKVALSKGKIQLHYRENEKDKSSVKDLIMVPGELVTIDSGGKAVSQKTQDPAVFSAWKDNRYIFEHTSLQEICTLFKDDFGVDVEITDPEISTWAVSGSFKASTAHELLEALAESSGLIYKQENKKIIIHSISVKNKP
jgi:transmembrane sensor